MLATVAVSGIDDRHRRNLGGAPGAALLVMAYHDYVAVTAHDADGVFHLLAFHLRGKTSRMLSRKHTSAKPVHGPFKRKTSSCRRLVEHRRHDLVLVVKSAASPCNSLHAPGTIEKLHQKRQRELLGFDNVLQFHISRGGSLLRSERKFGFKARVNHSYPPPAGMAKRVQFSSSAWRGSGTTCVPANPDTAAQRCSQDVMIASVPPFRRNRSTDSTFGPIFPGGK